MEQYLKVACIICYSAVILLCMVYISEEGRVIPLVASERLARAIVRVVFYNNSAAVIL